MMTKTCNLYETTVDGANLVAVVTLEGIYLSIHMEGGRGYSAGEILGQNNNIGVKSWDSNDNPVEWFNALPAQYHGSYFYAVMQ